MTRIEKRVRRGAALLDRERPGWAAEIDTDRLAMRSDRDCVLGQLYGTFGVGSLKICFRQGYRHDLSPRALGFQAGMMPWWRLLSADEDAMHRWLDSQYGPLRDAWIAEVRARTAGIEAEATALELAEAAA